MKRRPFLALLLFSSLLGLAPWAGYLGAETYPRSPERACWVPAPMQTGWRAVPAPRPTPSIRNSLDDQTEDPACP